MAMKVAAVGGMFEGQNAIIKARLTTTAGVMISSDGASSTQQADANATVKVFDKHATPATALNATTTVARATCFVAGATGYLTTGWTKDNTGYNFAVVIPDGDGTGFTVDWKGGKSYTVEITVSCDSVASPATINPGTQAEGALTFAVDINVDATLGVS